MYVSSASSYQLTLLSDGSARVRDIRGTEGSDTLSSIERIRFADRTVITENREHESFADLPESMYQFFILAFAAAPGVEYLQQCADAYRAGASVKLITNVFTSKNQFTDVYATTLTNRELATKLIANVVGKSAGEATKAQAVEDITAAMNNGLLGIPGG